MIFISDIISYRLSSPLPSPPTRLPICHINIDINIEYEDFRKFSSKWP